MSKASFSWIVVNKVDMQCAWGDMMLRANYNGTWSVYRVGKLIVDHRQQTAGVNLRDAQRRVQGVAMSLL